ncbi:MULTISPECIES: indolepyruvate oxidoreductase subunit beta [Ruminococcus]|jgi:indolepyruvate ferredoxin oxidoreductase beta subunit|uniref:Indolepyruvate ferredoxin oxidoreductase beta subunit n=1 Tax=Ruminococcus flavefaciens TaxID=1265 RepID=A0A315XVB6_RUMFL|nr:MULTISPECIES: indolepyruvate oxidoreductase subunit beta [Ruminococcus]MBQ6168756.1 indolepyruvate oxidoreductase subunit beta [Ruminococcus sp.]MBR1431675.1 indolepyruvate oxidoreductase subunit beta [Ruminococcus sp.]MBR1433445.1 indolepyruvate oxidoreductase subunit beta [Ruminococcus sp.]MBR3667493.1 indolepyruvate oxidoreductase subunit beta [Ruminococcus sp.]PWJ11024.1 indolepyruvate ferredoxin oxidoreductase beta subunit [Ruminococcus flavefaciens]
MQSNILICGVGGQGIVLTSKLIAATAMEHDIPVMSAETIGMAQKGGSVFSFLRLGDDIYCPMFPEKTADIIIGFEPAEAVRMLPYLRDGGQVVVNTHPIMPVTATLSGSDYTGNEMLDYLQRNVENVVLVDGNRAIEEIGSPKVLNMVMLGAAVRNGVLPFSVDDIEDTMKKTVRPQFVELNSKALRYDIK